MGIRNTPFEQGELDGSCAAYAIANAVVLMREYDESTLREIYRKLMSAVNWDTAVGLLSEGIDTEAMQALYREANEILSDCGLIIEERNYAPRIDSFFKTAGRAIKEEGAAVIFGFDRSDGGDEIDEADDTDDFDGFDVFEDDSEPGHWTVTKSISKRQVRLFDAGMQIMNKADMTAGTVQRKRYRVDGILFVMIEKDS